jgi:chromosome segregation ATPase
LACKIHDLPTILIKNKNYDDLDDNERYIFGQLNDYFGDNIQKVLIKLYIKYHIMSGGGVKNSEYQKIILEIGTLQTKISDLEKKIISENTNIPEKHKNKSITDFDNEIKSKDTQLVENKKQYTQKETENYVETLDNLKKENQVLDSKVKKFEISVKEITEKYNTLKTINTNLKDDNINIKRKLSDYIKKNEVLEKNNKDLSDSNKKLKISIDTLLT